MAHKRVYIFFLRNATKAATTTQEMSWNWADLTLQSQVSGNDLDRQLKKKNEIGFSRRYAYRTHADEDAYNHSVLVCECYANKNICLAGSFAPVAYENTVSSSVKSHLK